MKIILPDSIKFMHRVEKPSHRTAYIAASLIVLAAIFYFSH